MATDEEIKRFFDTFIGDNIASLKGRINAVFPDLEVASYPLCVVDVVTGIQKRDYLYPYGSNWRKVVMFSIVSDDNLQVDQLKDDLDDLLFAKEKEFSGFRSRGIIDQSPVYQRATIGTEKRRIFERDLLLDVEFYKPRS